VSCGVVAALLVLCGGADAADWRVLVIHDTCPDVTWGLTEDQTRQAFADLVRSHLDQMQREDSAPAGDRDHFNMATTQEALDFVGRYPGRKDELVRRIREGRVWMSPFLCNSLWGFQDIEGAIRTLMPSRRLERQWDMSLDVAEHIELPSLPWGQATLLAGCGVRWVSVPFLDYDCTFKGLTNPPVFRWVGPDGSEVRVVLDAWACSRANYAQGALLLKEPRRITEEWVPHYQALAGEYPLRVILASGSHSDISPDSGRQVQGFAQAIERYNTAAPAGQARLVSGTLPQFTAEADAAQKASPFLPALTGCFGHSWELWPVSLAGIAAAARVQGRAYLAAESLVTLACRARPDLGDQTRGDREKAEWFWVMLSDHAWNGTDQANRRHNAELRRAWAHGLARVSADLTARAWKALGLRPDRQTLTVFNPLSFSSDVLVVCDVPPHMHGITAAGRPVEAQPTLQEGHTQLAFVAAKVPAFGFREFRVVAKPSQPREGPFRVSATQLDGPFYHLVADPCLGGLRSLVHRPTGQELLRGGSGRTICQTVVFDGQEHRMTDVTSECLDHGPVFARLAIRGRIGDMRVTTTVTLYAALDRVDFDVAVHKPPTAGKQRLLHLFPVGEGCQDLRLETTAAVVRPRMQPEGDLLPGADTRRFAVQGFLDYSPARRVGVTLSSQEAFAVRLDQGDPAFEALGNDQNYKEVTRDQDGEEDFRFRYSLRAHSPGYDNAAAVAWSRAVSAPVTFAWGAIDRKRIDRAWLEVDPARAIVTCLKPADEDPGQAAVVRVWETAGKAGPVSLRVPSYRRAKATDLLERTGDPLVLRQGQTSVVVHGLGLAAVRLEP
jgi:hypothetical protein